MTSSVPFLHFFIQSVMAVSQLFFSTSKTQLFFLVIVINCLLACCPHLTTASSFLTSQTFTSPPQPRSPCLELSPFITTGCWLLPLPLQSFDFFVSPGRAYHARLSNFSIHPPCTSPLPGPFVFSPFSWLCALHNHPLCLGHLSSSLSKASLVPILTSPTLQNCEH